MISSYLFLIVLEKLYPTIKEEKINIAISIKILKFLFKIKVKSKINTIPIKYRKIVIVCHQNERN